MIGVELFLDKSDHVGCYRTALRFLLFLSRCEIGEVWRDSSRAVQLKEIS